MKFYLVGILFVFGVTAIGFLDYAEAVNANLFISAENSQFNNYFSGPQVIEVVIIDSDIKKTTEPQGEPDVTVNGKQLRMVQAVDGNWYGYFADKNMATIADSSTTTLGQGLDFGGICDSAQASISVSTSSNTHVFEDTSAMAISDPSCGILFDPKNINVVREERSINQGNNIVLPGQIGVKPNSWPFIQLYSLNPTGNVVVQYNKGGFFQQTTLTFDTVDHFVRTELDRPFYPTNSQVHVTITDQWLNIDPTDEDSWTFGTDGKGISFDATTHYQVFDENGRNDGDILDNTDNSLTQILDNLMCEDNCRLVTDVDFHGVGPIITLQDNRDSEIASNVGSSNPQNPFDWATKNGNLAHKVPITITEFGPNSGVFGTYDEADESAIIITKNAVSGASAYIDYNERPITIFTGPSSGNVDIRLQDSEWNSGEEISVMVFDPDANKNSRADEDLDFYNPEVLLIPSLKTGNPATLKHLKNSDLGGTLANGLTIDTVQEFSDRAILRSSGITVSEGSTVTFSLGRIEDFTKSAPLNDTSFRGIALLNYDLRSFSGYLTEDVFSTVSISVNGVSLGSGHPLQDLIVISDATHSPSSFPTDVEPNVSFTFSTTKSQPIAKNILLPVAVDVFGFGFIDDGVDPLERISNQIIRIEAEETGDNTNNFEASLEFVMVNQLNILDSGTYTGLTAIGDDPSFIVMDALIGENSPKVSYNDLGSDGNSREIFDQQSAPYHSGVVTFDKNSYLPGSLVFVTLQDQDLNVHDDYIDIYTLVPPSLYPTFEFQDPASGKLLDNAYGTIGEAGLPTFDFGPMGGMFQISFDGSRWVTPIAILGDKNSERCLSDLKSTGAETGFDDAQFAFIETSPDSGIFTADFRIPEFWCRSTDTSSSDSDQIFEWKNKIEKIEGLDMMAQYLDYRDEFGNITTIIATASTSSSDKNYICDSSVSLTKVDGNLIVPDEKHCTLRIGLDINGDIIVGKNSSLVLESTGLVSKVNGKITSKDSSKVELYRLIVKEDVDIENISSLTLEQLELRGDLSVKNSKDISSLLIFNNNKMKNVQITKNTSNLLVIIENKIEGDLIVQNNNSRVGLVNNHIGGNLKVIHNFYDSSGFTQIQNNIIDDLAQCHNNAPKVGDLGIPNTYNRKNIGCP